MKTTIPIILSAILLTAAVEADEERRVIKLPIIQNSHRSKIRSKFKRDNSNVDLYNAASKEYLVQVGFGTPPQHFNVTFDTGSADIWIPSQACPTTMCPFDRFNAPKSSTFKQLPGKLDIEYGIGAAKGTYGSDVITLGSSSILNHTFGLVNDTTNILVTSTVDIEPSNGILGLGYPGLSTKIGEKPSHVVMDLYNAKVISQPIFSIFLNSPFALGFSGELMLGGVDSNKYSGEIQYAPVVTYDFSQYYISANLGANKTTTSAGSKVVNLYWTVPGQGITTSNGYNYAAKNLQGFILDSGTTLTYVPPAIASNIVSSIVKNKTAIPFDAVNGVYKVDCKLAGKESSSVSFLVSPSDTSISSSPIEIKIPVSDLILPLDDALTPDTSKSCMFGIAPSPVGLDLTSDDTYILGESVMRGFYAVFDLQNNRVGIANLSNGTTMTTSEENGTTIAAKSTGDKSTSHSNANTLYPSSSLLITLGLLFLVFLK